jgi:hypothetical protein
MNTEKEKYRELTLSATRSKLSYLAPNDIYNLWLNSEADKNSIIYYIFKDVEKQPIFYEDDKKSAQGYSWIDNRTLHISFRGTEDLSDIKTDIKVLESQLFHDNKSILVHKGFLLYFQILEKDITEEVNNNIDNIDVIHFTGHSLGAGIATIAAAWYSDYIKNILNKDKKIITHTIGSPRVGNSSFVKYYNTNITENIRVANYKDPITLFPISLFYKHVDNCVFLKENSEKDIKKDKNFLLRLITLPFDIYYRSPFSFHHCDVYVKRLLKLSEWDIEISF